jgi:hypothetical protein
LHFDQSALGLAKKYRGDANMTDTTALPNLSLNRGAQIQVWKIGQEQQPVFVIDNALTDAQPLIDFACEQVPFLPPAEGSYYPGLNAQLPDSYLDLLTAGLQRPLVNLFGMPAGRPLPYFGYYGLTTLPPTQMGLRQALPHTDTSRLHAYAVVHYLSRNPLGGTAFYRHRATGFEYLNPVRVAAFEQARNAEVTASQSQPDTALSDLYEEIAYVEPVFNRLILYHASQLHSARLENSRQLTDDPRTGRLTANLFINT